jgi:hypothetical protein
MSSPFTYVDGADLVSLILDVRNEFVNRLPYELDTMRRPNTVWLVAVEVFDERSPADQAAVVRDLMHENRCLTFTRRTASDIFCHATTVADYVVDLVCEAVCEILLRDPLIREETERREALALESREESDDRQLYLEGDYPL